jgi:hypothetical protein
MTFKLDTQLKAPVAPVPKENMRHLPRQARDEQKREKGKLASSSFCERARTAVHLYCNGASPICTLRPSCCFTLRKTKLLYERFLCLSQACLGKDLDFTVKWLKRAFFAPLESVPHLPSHCSGSSSNNNPPHVSTISRSCILIAILIAKRMFLCTPRCLLRMYSETVSEVAYRNALRGRSEA